MTLSKEHYIPKDIVDVKRTKPPHAYVDRLGYPSEKRGAGTAAMVRLRGEKTWRRVMSSSHGVLWVVMNGKKRYLGSSMIPDSKLQAARWNRQSRHMSSRSRHLRYLREHDPESYDSRLTYHEARRRALHTKTKRRR